MRFKLIKRIKLKKNICKFELLFFQTSATKIVYIQIANKSKIYRFDFFIHDRS